MNNSVSRKAKLPHVTQKTIRTAAEERGRQEGWALPLTVFGNQFPHRLSALVDTVDRKFSHTDRTSIQVRNLTLRALAYMQMETRLRFLLDLSTRNANALNNLLGEPVDSPYEIFRVNIIGSLGVVSRHGMINEVLTKERLSMVAQEYSKQIAKDVDEKNGDSA